MTAERDALAGFDSWWRTSKYCQVVFPERGWEQIARDAWAAARAVLAAQPDNDQSGREGNKANGVAEQSTPQAGAPTQGEFAEYLAPDPTAAPAQGEPQERMGTHWDGCSTEGGPRHYDCAVAAIAALRAERDALECANASLNVEVDRLYACRNELQEVTRTMNDPTINIIHTLNEAVHSLRAERDALRADAERYRWLRDEAPSDWIGWAEERDAAEATAPEVDAAIDRARASQPGGQERSSVGRTDVVAGSSPAASVSPDPTAAPAKGEPLGDHYCPVCKLHHADARGRCRCQGDKPAQGEPNPVAWRIAPLDGNGATAYREWEGNHAPGWTYTPLYTADAIAALRAERERQAREIRTLRNIAVTADERAERAEAERDALRECVKAADVLRYCPSGSAYDDARHSYDAARAKVQP